LRVTKCKTCLRRGHAFCDRKQAAEVAGTAVGWIPKMDECVPHSTESRGWCQDFELYSVSMDGGNGFWEGKPTGGLRGQRDETEFVFHPWYVDTAERCDELEHAPPAVLEVTLQSKRRKFMDEVGLHESVDAATSCLGDDSGADRVRMAHRELEHELGRKNLGCKAGFQCCSTVNETLGAEMFRCVETEGLPQKFEVLKMGRVRQCKGFHPGDVPAKWSNAANADCRIAHTDLVDRRSKLAKTSGRHFGTAMTVYQGHWSKRKQAWFQEEEHLITRNVSALRFTVGEAVEATESSQASGQRYYPGLTGEVVEAQKCKVVNEDQGDLVAEASGCAQDHHCVLLAAATDPVCIPDAHLQPAATHPVLLASAAAGCPAGFLCCIEPALKRSRCVRQDDLPEHRTFWRTYRQCADFRPPGSTSKRKWEGGESCAAPGVRSEGNWVKGSRGWHREVPKEL